MRAPKICCASYSNRLERSYHLWASTFFLNFAPYPLMYAYLPTFVCLHSIHDLCRSHSISRKLQSSLLRKRSPSLRKRCAVFLATQTMLLSFATQEHVALFLLRIPWNCLYHCAKSFEPIVYASLPLAQFTSHSTKVCCSYPSQTLALLVCCASFLVEFQDIFALNNLKLTSQRWHHRKRRNTREEMC